jgi:hypothetical protein
MALATVHPNAATIDVGATMHMAAVRADRTPEPVRNFGTFTTDLHRLVDWFIATEPRTCLLWSKHSHSTTLTTRRYRPATPGSKPS